MKKHKAAKKPAAKKGGALKKFAAEPVRLYKSSSWNPAPMPELENLASRIDYAFIGVGA